MKVDGSDPLSRLRNMLDKMDETDRTARTRSSEVAAAPGKDRSSSTGDSVQLSERAQEIHRLRDAIEMSPETRGELVARLREEIATGQYRIDGTKIASAMLEDDLSS